MCMPVSALIPAASYARISEKDEKRDKVADQHTANEQHAARRGYTIVARYQDDGISALGGKERPDFERMLLDAAAGKFKAIIATEEERLARNVPEKIELHAACEDAGIVFDTDRDGYVDPSTDSGEFMSTVRAAMGRIESRRKARRQKGANVARASRGEPNPGKRRYGYETDGKTPREAEAVIVRRIFEHVAAGKSVRSIALDLAAEGVDPGTAKAWRPGRVREIAGNPHYGGAMRYRGEVIPSSVIVPIVDPELAADVRDILADEKRRTSPGSQPRHLLSGIATCGTCDAPMVRQRTYVCSAGSKEGHANITPAALETPVLQELALAILLAGDRLTPEDSRETIRSHVAALARNDQAAASTAADRDEGLLSPAAARTRLLELRDERQRLEAELDRARASVGALAPLADVASALVSGVDSVPMAEVWAARDVVAARVLELDPGQQRDTVRAFLEVAVEPFYVRDADGRKVRNAAPRIQVWHKIATELNAPDSPV